MISDLAKSALELIKLSPRYLAAVVLATAALLFLPASSLEHLGLPAFAQTHRQWLGLAFLASSSICCAAVGAVAWNQVDSVYRRRGARKRLIQRLQTLTEDEKEILRYYYAEGTRSNTLKTDDGVVQGLVAVGIIYRSASLGNILEGFAHNISDVAWEYIQSHPDTLVGRTNTCRTDKRLRGWY